jgi:class 3 adenylate cyclase
LEEAAKTFGDTDREVNILISGSVRSSLVESFDMVHVGPRELRGREEQVEIYMLKGDCP